MDIRTLDDSDPLPGSSKLLDAVQKAIDFAQENDGIGLTKSRAFNRKFATWAAENFNWPEYSADQLLRIQKVLNEEDVIPVRVLHELIISMKLGRHTKGKWRFSKKAELLAQTPGVLQAALTRGFLFEFDHSRLQRFPFVAAGNWEIWLNVINLEAHGGVSEAALLKTFYGVEYSGAGDREFWDHASFLMWHVLKPLSWLTAQNPTAVARDEEGNRRKADEQNHEDPAEHLSVDGLHGFNTAGTAGEGERPHHKVRKRPVRRRRRGHRQGWRIGSGKKWWTCRLLHFSAGGR